MDCGKALGEAAKSHGTKRCYPCSAIARRLPRPVCMDCGKPLARLGSKRCKECADKINLNWIGRHHRPEIREKIRQVRTGTHLPEEVRAKLRAAHAGEKNHFWGKHHKPESITKNSLAHSGPNNVHYRDGRGGLPYVSDWSTIRKQICERDEHLCQHPGCYAPENGRRHDCHHIDRNKNNNHPTNLILLCHKHHVATFFGDPDSWIEFYDSIQVVRGIKTETIFMEDNMATLNSMKGEI